jgi:AraC-like DNA-binding protein
MKRLAGVVFVFLIFLNPGLSCIQDQLPEISPGRLIRNLKNKEFTGRAVDLDFESVTLEEIFSRFEEISGLDFEVAAEGGLLRKYTFRMIPWDKAVDLVCSDFGLELRLVGGILEVRKGTLKKKIPLFVLALVLVLCAAAFVLFGFRFLAFIQNRKMKNRRGKRYPLSGEKISEVKKSLSFFFEVEKLYRDDSLTLNLLAERLSLPPHQLSWIINAKMGKSFSDLINHYRVEEIKKRLGEPDMREKTILEIAFGAGFKTKSAFNKAFKKFTGRIPRDFRVKSSKM